MPTGHNKIGSGRTGRILRVGRDLFSITLDDHLLWRTVRQRIHGPTAQIRVAQQAAADRKKRIAAERRKMAKQDRKTIKILEARRIAFLVAGEKEEADRCQEAINDLQGRR